MAIIIILLIMTGLFMISLNYMKRYVLLRQRVEKIAAPFSTAKESTESKQDVFKKKYINVSRAILNFLHVLSADTTKALVKQLTDAGFLSKNALVVFLSIQMVSIFSSIFLAIVLVLFVPAIAEKSFLIKATVLIVLMYVGSRFPEWYLKRKAKKYHIKLRRSILDFLDLFLICVEAGFGNDKALDRISYELEDLHPELCEQINLLITQLRILPNRRDAWDNFAERMGIEEAKVISQIIKQSEQLGSSITQALRAQVELFRGERLSYVEQKAMRLPTLLTLPLVLFIFPALLLVILGPAILKAMDVLG